MSQSYYLAKPIQAPNIEDTKYEYTIADDTTGAKVVIGDKEIKMTRTTNSDGTTDGYEQYSNNIKSDVISSIKSWYSKFLLNTDVKSKLDTGSYAVDINNARFKIMFNIGETSSPEDNIYSLYMLAKKKGDITYKLYKCNADGSLDL